MKETHRNLAFIDGQNLHMGTAKRDENPWVVDLYRFRIYLIKKYHVETAYYFLGFVQDNTDEMYDRIQDAGFILKFKEHNSAMLGKKKGNVDSDIIFDVMRRLYKENNFDKVVLVSGDGDYKKLVDFLIGEDRFEKILLPNRRFASSLYKRTLNPLYYDYLDVPGIREKIELKKRVSLGS